VSQEIPWILRNTSVYYPVHNSPAKRTCAESHQFSQCHSILPREYTVNIFHPSTPRSFKWFLYLTFPHQSSVCTFLPHQIYTPLVSQIL